MHLWDTISPPAIEATLTPARARRTDPATSHEAAAKVTRSGKAAAHRQIVLDALRSHPRTTYRELAEVCGLEHHEVMKRLNDLRHNGDAVNPKDGDELIRRACRVTGNSMTIWEAVNQETQ